MRGIPPYAGTGFSGVGYRVFLGGTPVFYRCARSIENFCRIKIVVAGASGMDLASILKRNTFLTLGVRRGGSGVRAGRGDTEPPPDGGTRGRPRTGGHGAAPGRGDTGPPPDGGTRGRLRTGGHGAAPGRGDTGGPPDPWYIT